MSQSVTVRFTPNERDYANVLRLFLWTRTGTRISFAFLLAAFALVLYGIVSKGTAPSAFEIVWLLLPPAFMYFVYYMQPGRMAKQAIKNEKLVTEATWEVSDTGVKISSKFDSTNMEWEKLNKLVTSRDYYLLLSKANKNAFRFLPRRAFTTPQEQDIFLEVVAKNLPGR